MMGKIQGYLLHKIKTKQFYMFFTITVKTAGTKNHFPMSQIPYCENSTTIVELLFFSCVFGSKGNKIDLPSVYSGLLRPALCCAGDWPLITVVLLEANTNTGSRSIHKSVSLMLATNKGDIGDPLKPNLPQICPVRPSLLNFEIIYCVSWPSGEPRFTFDAYSGCQRLTVDRVRLTGLFNVKSVECWPTAEGQSSVNTHPHLGKVIPV